MAGVENALSQSEKPLSVREISNQLALDCEIENSKNLRIRVHRSLKHLVDNNIAKQDGMVKHGHINSYTYSIMENQKRDRGFLRGMATKTEQMKAQAMASMVKPMIPGMQKMFCDKIAQLESSEAEGGILKEGETKAGYWVSAHDGELIFSECALSYNKALGKMVMSKPTSTKSLLQFLTEQNGN